MKQKITKFMELQQHYYNNGIYLIAVGVGRNRKYILSAVQSVKFKTTETGTQMAPTLTIFAKERIDDCKTMIKEFWQDYPREYVKEAV